jgi:ribosomal protein S18 acetylase RimI-like enzyme
MEVRDFAAVYELGLRCYDITDKPYNYWSLAEVADHLQRNPELCFVADVEGEVAGFILGDATFEIIEDTAHLEWIAVSPDHRRRGIADALLTAAVAAVQALGKMRIVADVASDNPHSPKLAQKHGFRKGLSVTYFTRELH